MSLARALHLRSTTARFAALTALVLLLTSGAVLAVTARLATRAIDAEIEQLTRLEAREIAIAFQRGGPPAAVALVEAELAEPGHKIMLLEGPAGRLAGNAQAWPPTLDTPARWYELELFVRGAAAPQQYGIVTLKLGDHRLLIGHALEERARLLRGLGEASIGAVIAALLLAGVGAWSLSRFIAARVRHAVEAAEAVAAGDLSRRVATTGDGDAFDTLAQALNRMLARIDALVSELRLVTDSLAHDLRSPLTRLKARIERAATDPDPRAAQAALEGVGAEADQLLRMLSLALEISRAEAGLGRESFAEADVAALLTDLAEMYEPLAEEAGIELAVATPGRTMARIHRELLGQAIANLIDNALKHGQATRIALSVTRVGDRLRLAVSDNGRGIPAEDRDRALTRFARLDAARSTPGAGLGLSLVAAVARLHGGTLALEDASPGLRAAFEVEAMT